jgi:hypothetical protein
MRESDVPVPPAIVTAAEYTLLKELGDLLTRASVDPLPERAFEIARELEAMELTAHASAYELLLRRAAEARADALRTDPFGPHLDALHRLLDLAGALGLSVNLWQVQNAYHAAVREQRAALLAAGDGARAVEFWRLGERLYFNLTSVRPAPEAAAAAPLAAD